MDNCWHQHQTDAFFQRGQPWWIVYGFIIAALSVLNPLSCLIHCAAHSAHTASMMHDHATAAANQTSVTLLCLFSMPMSDGPAQAPASNNTPLALDPAGPQAIYPIVLLGSALLVLNPWLIDWLRGIRVPRPVGIRVPILPPPK